MQIAPADKNFRRQVIRFLAVVTGLGLVSIQWGVPAVLRYLNRLDPADGLLLAEILLGLVFVSVVPLGLYLVWLAQRIVREERFPPSGVRLLRDTPVVQGGPARLRGRALWIFGSVLILLGLIGPFYLHYSFQRLTREGSFYWLS